MKGLFTSTWHVVLLAAALSFPSACDSSQTFSPVSRGGTQDEMPAVTDTLFTLDAPLRAAGAPTGTAVMEAWAGQPAAERQQRVVAHILAGNIPDELRALHPVSFVAEGGDTLTVHVTGDYLAVGSSANFVRTPLSMPSAREIARTLGMHLPTTRLVDAIYAQADLRLTPQPMPPLPEMTSNGYFVQHQQLIEAQRNGRGQGELLAGHKKDVVYTPRLLTEPGRVAIYGWHRSVGDPIQPLSLVHGEGYADYSHGLRLVHPVALLRGTPVALQDYMDTPDWSQ